MPHSRKILYIEDTSAAQLKILQLLSQLGYDVQRYPASGATVDQVLTFHPNMVLIDCRSEVARGLEVCRELRIQNSQLDLPVILLAKYEDTETLSRGIEAGANDVLLEGTHDTVLLARFNIHLQLVKQRAELRKAEESMCQMIQVQNALCNMLPMGVVVHDRNGKVVHTNQFLNDWCRGLVPETFLDLRETLCDGALSELIARQWNELRDSSIALDEEVVTRHFLYRNISVTSAPIFVNFEQELRLWTFKDVTDSKELELKRHVDVALESVSTFVHGVAHNFNNILASVLGSATLLARQDIRDKRARACIDAIRKGAESGAALTRKMMVMVRDPIAGNDGQLENITSVLSLIIESFEEQYGERITFELNVDEELPQIQINVRNLADIFSNILTNAVDSIAAEGWILIRARYRRLLDKIEVAVSDTGRGMEEKALRRLFEPFYTTKNIDTAHQVSRTGNGLGMWNVYNLVRLLGGDIQVESTINEGTRVTVTLPAFQGDTESESVRNSPDLTGRSSMS